jgi:hypothetical protein
MVNATDVAIVMAYKNGTLDYVSKKGRFGDYIAISDDFGIIEVAFSMAEAKSRVDSLIIEVALSMAEAKSRVDSLLSKVSVAS